MPFTPTVWQSSVSLKRVIYRLRRNKICVFIIISFISSSLLFWHTRKPVVLDEQEDIESMFFDDSIDGGCKFPKLNPFSELAMKYNKDLPKIVCPGEDWVECNVTECHVKSSILDSMNVVCHYKDIIHIDDHNYHIRAPVTVENEGVYMLNQSDYFKVSCFGYKKNGFSLFAKRWHGYKSGIMHLETPPSPPGREHSINVLILGFDSASRDAFIRKLPKSYLTIKNELDAVILNGYNIVGDGTSCALFPILSGRTGLEHHPSARQKLSKDVYLNPDLFIFHIAKEDGYRTAYFEDMPIIGSFQYRYNGFSRKPADHYLRSFFLEETKFGAKWWRGLDERYCVGAIPSYMFMLDLTKQFMSLSTKRFCFTFIADISHDDIELLATADDDLVDFLRDFKKSGKLKETLLIVMGDHGPRFSPLRAFYQGKIEERMPFVSIILPEKLKKNRPDALFALKANADVLTSPFDIHTTILDAMGLKRYSNSYTLPKSNLPRGMSLLTPIPRSRSCEDAGILPHWCVCLNTNWRSVPQTDEFHDKAAKTLANFVNNITNDKRSLCEERTLKSISWVIRQHLKAGNRSKSRPIYFQASIVMNPGLSVFEGTMQYFQDSDSFDISEKDVSRISPLVLHFTGYTHYIQDVKKTLSDSKEVYRYGNEPSCISATEPYLNKYCYCKNNQFAPFQFLH